MTNPISARARGVLYLISLAIGILAVMVGPLSDALGWSPEWTQVVVVLVGAVTTLTALLARANLPSPDTPTEAPERALIE